MLHKHGRRRRSTESYKRKSKYLHWYIGRFFFVCAAEKSPMLMLAAEAPSRTQVVRQTRQNAIPCILANKGTKKKRIALSPPPHFVSWFSAPCCYPILAKIDRVPKSGLISLSLTIKSSKIFLFSIPKLDLKPWHYTTVFENLRKSLIQHCERSELRLHFEWTKVH